MITSETVVSGVFYFLKVPVPQLHKYWYRYRYVTWNSGDELCLLAESDRLVLR